MRQYIGSRYVPIFGRLGESSAEWDNTKAYEPLTVVLHNGNSYTSRQFVPVGIDIANTDFWALTGNYNAQVEQYRREVLDFADSIVEKAFAFDTVANMQDSDALYAGAICRTNGFHASGDGGAAYYIISASGTANGMDVLALHGELFAHLMIESYVTPEQLGAWGDDTHDDTAIVQYLVGKTDCIKFQDGKTNIVSAVTVPAKDVTLYGNGTIHVTGDGFVFNAPTNVKRILDLEFVVDADATALTFLGDSRTEPFNTLLIDNVRMQAGALSTAIGLNIQSENEAVISNSSFYGCSNYINDSINPCVTNCTFRMAKNGIYSGNTKAGRNAYSCGLRITSCTFLGCNIGIKTVESDSIQIQSCMIDYNDYSIIVIGTGSAKIAGCYISARGGNPAIYIDRNNSDSGVFGGNGLNIEPASGFIISDCTVLQHDRTVASPSSAIVAKYAERSIMSDVVISFCAKAGIELHNCTRMKISGCNISSDVQSAIALVSYVNGTLGDDSSNFYKDIVTPLPIYVKFAKTDIYEPRSFITKDHGTVITSTSPATVNTNIAQGIDYVLLFSNNKLLSYSIASNQKSFTINIPDISGATRINWIAYGKTTYGSF